ncbi:MAG: hypothetical protein P4L46_10240 [Fimbriimonas sp.]|nr:hypothetical protein [Fimbriimonas sp.]
MQNKFMTFTLPLAIGGATGLMLLASADKSPRLPAELPIRPSVPGLQTTLDKLTAESTLDQSKVRLGLLTDLAEFKRHQKARSAVIRDLYREKIINSDDDCVAASVVSITDIQTYRYLTVAHSGRSRE